MSIEGRGPEKHGDLINGLSERPANTLTNGLANSLANSRITRPLMALLRTREPWRRSGMDHGGNMSVWERV